MTIAATPLTFSAALPAFRRSLNGEAAVRRTIRGAVRDRTDESLMEAHVAGDAQALEVLVRRYRDELFHFLVRFLGSRAAAEDVFQETFLQVHLSAESFNVSRRFKPWLFTIAANKARDHHRRHARRTGLSLSAPLGEEPDATRFVDLLDAGVPGPEAPILDSERSRMVREVVDAMPPHLREILLMSYFQKLSYNQLADALSIPLGTVKSRLHAAVAAFARAWKATQSSSMNDADERGDNRQ